MYEFRILGPLEVRVAGRIVPITAPRDQVALTTLLLAQGQVVAVERLVDAIWTDRPPTDPANQISICVSSLRRRLGAAAAPDQLIVTAPPGYALCVDEAEFDINQVEAYAAEAQRFAVENDETKAAERLSSALSVWRGPVLAGITSQSLRPDIVRWEERRLALTEQYAYLMLKLSRGHEIIGDLAAGVADHPLRERPRALLMSALHQSGRRAEALEEYADIRRHLRSELGLEPGEELRAAQEAVLRGRLHVGARSAAAPTHGSDHPLAVSAAGRSPAPGSGDGHARHRWPTAAMLPADIADFTARDKEFGELAHALTSVTGTAVPVAVISGPGGTGKTALAVHVAHYLADAYPDGQLHARLLGPEGRPVPSADVLHSFLLALSVPGRLIPEDVEVRKGMYRSLVAGRRILIALDDVVSETQMEALLPGAPTCGVLATSRARLTGLAGVHSMELGLFTPDDATALLCSVLGGQRVEAEREVAARIVQYCGCLPLAVRIAGARLAAKPHWTLSYFARQLAEDGGRLDELTHGTLNIRASIERSYRRLSSAAQLLFHRLGHTDGPGCITLAETSALTIHCPQLMDAIEELVDTRLLEVVERGPSSMVAYHMHDLVWLYANEQGSHRVSTPHLPCFCSMT